MNSRQELWQPDFSPCKGSSRMTPTPSITPSQLVYHICSIDKAKSGCICSENVKQVLFGL